MIDNNVIKPALKWDAAAGARRHEEALAGLRALVHRFPDFDQPVLTLTPAVKLLWMENNVLESLLYARYDPAAALGTHELFFRQQRADGLFPCMLGSGTKDGPAEYLGFSQIQQNVPIARTSWELAKLTGKEDFLAKAYAACARFDDWVRTYRDTRKTGLVEMFCTFDMGQDNSPRCTKIGMSNACPNKDAAQCPPYENLPVLAPDLSAVVYGARRALSEMATALDKPEEAAMWTERAETLRALIFKHCQDQDDGFFYDVDPRGRHLHFRGSQLFTMAQEHLFTPAEFELIWCRYLRNPHEFWTPYPFANFSVSDPHFDRKYLGNSWAGPANCNIALRTLLWMEHYGKHDDMRTLMERWVSIHLRYGFYWQINPWTGDPSMDPGEIAWFTEGNPMSNMSVCYLVFTEFTRKLGLIG
ncbi:MAG: alpha-L-rhamnosidase [Verrucomicrobiae bacterium]